VTPATPAQAEADAFFAKRVIPGERYAAAIGRIGAELDFIDLDMRSPAEALEHIRAAVRELRS
jgi:hypothetical protein